jgi:hypothetical protein
VHAVLRRCWMYRLSHLYRATGEPIRHYEHDHPGSLVHVDVKKLGNIPDGGGRRRCKTRCKPLQTVVACVVHSPQR